VHSGDTIGGLLGTTLLLAGPRNGFVRCAVDLHGLFLEQVGWFEPPLTDSVEWYDGTKRNSLRLDISCAYLRLNAARRRAIVCNAGVSGGGVRTYSRASDTASWFMGSGEERQIDSMGAFVEGSLARQFGNERWQLFAALSGLAGLVYDYDAQTEHDRWIDLLRNDRRTDRIRVDTPLLVRVFVVPEVSLFCAWQPGLRYGRVRAPAEPGTASTTETSRLVLDEGALGVRWTPSDHFQIALVPSLKDGVFLSSAEALLRW